MREFEVKKPRQDRYMKMRYGESVDTNTGKEEENYVWTNVETRCG